MQTGCRPSIGASAATQKAVIAAVAVLVRAIAALSLDAVRGRLVELVFYRRMRRDYLCQRTRHRALGFFDQAVFVSMNEVADAEERCERNGKNNACNRPMQLE